jgi:uncharacterized paraquat-inducible protein A
MQYVKCPNCGDPVAGKFPQAGEEQTLQCVRCKTKFPFEPRDIIGRIVTFNFETNRWEVGKMASF